MEHAEANHIINPGQYGSRPSRGAHDPVFIEEFQLEIIRSSRKSLVQTNYDATSCYDRVIPNLAALVSQRFGVPQPAVQTTNVCTLEKAKYRLRTEIGLSEASYSHTVENPIYGTGQGSGNSPMIWCFLSSVLFDSYETKANGAIYETPDKLLRTKLHMVGYVDDSNGQTNAFLDNIQPTDRLLLHKTQQDAQLWHDLLRASGGALELPKCVYQLMSWRFLNDGRPLLQGGVSAHTVRICQHGIPESTQHIPGLSAYTAHKT
jgi:Reverse transcriptase (RNA-dependent DNA polymerase)